MVYFRKREDAINSIIAGFSTGFILAIRGGFRNAMRSGLIGGLFLAIIETVMIVWQQKARRDEIIAKNKEVKKIKGEIEKQYGRKIFSIFIYLMIKKTKKRTMMVWKHIQNQIHIILVELKFFIRQNNNIKTCTLKGKLIINISSFIYYRIINKHS